MSVESIRGRLERHAVLPLATVGALLLGGTISACQSEGDNLQPVQQIEQVGSPDEYALTSEDRQDIRDTWQEGVSYWAKNEGVSAEVIEGGGIRVLSGIESYICSRTDGASVLIDGYSRSQYCIGDSTAVITAVDVHDYEALARGWASSNNENPDAFGRAGINFIVLHELGHREDAAEGEVFTNPLDSELSANSNAGAVMTSMYSSDMICKIGGMLEGGVLADDPGVHGTAEQQVTAVLAGAGLSPEACS